MKECDRCGMLDNHYYVSWYNEQEICSCCRKSEEGRSDYQECRKAELDAVKRGDLNFCFKPPWKEWYC